MASEWRVVWSPAALKDLDGIIDYIDVESPANARGVFARLAKRVESLQNLPGRGEVVRGGSTSIDRSLRELIEGPWRIIYSVEGDGVVVMGIVDSRRDVEAFLEQRLSGGWPTDN